ncbi:MAG: cysteine dioxygenase [Sneathiella sp.]
MSIAEQRQSRIKKSVDRIRELVGEMAPDLDILQKIKGELIELASDKHLFSLEDFPPPEDGGQKNNCLYRLWEDDDHRFALYANAASGAVKAPPHDHTTWAVIVGLYGQEENRFYRKTEAGAEMTGSYNVEEGTGVTLLPDDIHSIHIVPGDPVLNFHMYGLALEQLPGRNYWSEPNKEWRVFPAHTDIREARG